VRIASGADDENLHPAELARDEQQQQQ